MSNLQLLAQKAFENASSKGFHDDKDFTSIEWQLSKIALIHSEGSELLEALRKDKGEDEIMSEISDILIRTLDFYYALLEGGVVNTNLDDAYRAKALKNSTRPQMHGVKA